MARGNRLDYEQPFGIRHLTNTENRRGTQRELAGAQRRAAGSRQRVARLGEQLSQDAERRTNGNS